MDGRGAARPGRGYTMPTMPRQPAWTQSPTPITLSEDLVSVPELWQAVAERLRGDILGGALPEGTQLVEAELASRFGTSRGPVRDALRELVRLSLAVDLPRKGVFVSSPDEQDLEDVYYARNAIEAAAVRLVIERAHDNELLELGRIVDEFERLYEAGDLWGARDIDLEFHHQLVRLSGNSRLVAAFEPLAPQTIMLLRRAHERGGASKPPSPELHRDVVAALQARDEARTVEAIEAHFGYVGSGPFAVASKR
jgi:DNA-binding GntR family transcriptional regulator